jgi:uncharacterized protein
MSENHAVFEVFRRRWYALAAALVLVLIVLPINRDAVQLPAKLQDGLTIFTGVIVEALPFIALGVVISALIRRFITPEILTKYIPKNSLISFPMVGLLGLALPVCECGNLPVARQLIRQGMRPSQAITFLLSAPIINPTVIISTLAAFYWIPGMLWARLGLGFAIAVSIGWIFAWLGDHHLTQRLSVAPIAEVATGDSSIKSIPMEENHVHGHANLAGMVDELLEMVSTISIGGIIAGIVQVTVPRSTLLGLADSPVTAILVMMGLALIVSLCSNVDAFFALSFAGTFSSASLLAFLVFGPMIDFRALALFSRSFTPKVLVLLTLFVAQGVFIGAIWIHYTGIL